VPIYEYECRGCSRRVSLLVRSLASRETPPKEVPRCPRCGSAEMSRLMSRFATPKSEDARLEAAADPSQYGDLDENDPQAVARMVKRMGDEMGEDLGDDLGEAMGEAMDEASDEPGGSEGGGFGDGDGEASLSETGGGDEG
jgi:putative FmdB family regulatory protein